MPARGAARYAIRAVVRRRGLAGHSPLSDRANRRHDRRALRRQGREGDAREPGGAPAARFSAGLVKSMANVAQRRDSVGAAGTAAHALNGASQPFYGPNLGYVLELYERYQANPASVDPETSAFFATWTPPSDAAVSAASPAFSSEADITRVLGAAAYAHAIRAHGHRGADLKPVGATLGGADSVPELLPATYGVSEADLASLPASVVGGPAAHDAANALEASQRLREIYCGPIGYELDHVQRTAERQWLHAAAESGRFRKPLSDDDKRALLERLTSVEAFERFLHQAFLGAKRFSIEGSDTLVPVLDGIIAGAARAGVHEVVVGMAHRGRLNVLAHVLGKPYESIIEEFSHGKRLGNSATDRSRPRLDGRREISSRRAARTAAKARRSKSRSSWRPTRAIWNMSIQWPRAWPRAAQEDRQPGGPANARPRLGAGRSCCTATRPSPARASWPRR